MDTLTFSTQIKAIPETIWNILWNKHSYKKWTSVFMEGSYYLAEDLLKGSKIHFLGPKGGGMYSVIDEVEVNKKMVFKHLGEVKNFKELPET